MVFTVNVFINFVIFTIMGVSRIFWGPEIQILSTLVGESLNISLYGPSLNTERYR